MSCPVEKTHGGEIHTQPYWLPFKMRERRAKTANQNNFRANQKHPREWEEGWLRIKENDYANHQSLHHHFHVGAEQRPHGIIPQRLGKDLLCKYLQCSPWGSEEQSLKIWFVFKQKEINSTEQSCACSSSLSSQLWPIIRSPIGFLPSRMGSGLSGFGVGCLGLYSQPHCCCRGGFGQCWSDSSSVLCNAINPQTPFAPSPHTFQLGKSSFWLENPALLSAPSQGSAASVGTRPCPAGLHVPLCPAFAIPALPEEWISH